MNVRKLNGNKALVRFDVVGRIIDATDLDLNDEAAVRARFDNVIKKPGIVAAPIPNVVLKRREKMQAIGQQSVRSRDRVFPTMPHVPASRKNQAYDGLIALLIRKRITEDDKIVVRHLKTGEYDEMTVGALLDEVGDMYLLQVELRRHDQVFRDRVNAIFRDKSLTDEQKAAAIDAIDIPEHLDIDHEKTTGHLNLARRSENGSKTNKT